jgi:hypothetical protein
MSPNRLAALAVPIVILALACSSEPTGPERALRDFYDNLNQGEYGAAMALYEEDFREFLEDPATGGTSFADWARNETKNGSITDVRVLSENTSAGKSAIEFEIEYADGSSSRRRVSLTETGGEWRLGVIG